jgi:hypothetical protein
MWRTPSIYISETWTDLTPTEQRKFTLIVGFLLVTMLMLLLASSAPVAADGPPFEFPRNKMAPDGPDIMDLTPDMLGEKEIAIRKEAAIVGSAEATRSGPLFSRFAMNRTTTVHRRPTSPVISPPARVQRITKTSCTSTRTTGQIGWDLTRIGPSSTKEHSPTNLSI